jgi:biotin operon repressor
MKEKEYLIEIISAHDIDNKIKCRNLARQLNVSEPFIRTIINELRIEGHAIGSDTKDGYFLAKDERELYHTKAQFTSRIRKMVDAMQGMTKGFSPQISMNL